jgi:5-methylcytosine-specific restriction endonuclease McrA
VIKTRNALLRLLKRELRALLAVRCREAGTSLDTFEYRTRYQNDPEYRQREVERTWERKRNSGVLRTDGRTCRRVSDDGTLTPDVVQRLFACCTHCAYCGELMTPRQKTLDHVMPVSRGGVHGVQNVVIACRRCNVRKGARTPEEWRATIDAARK